MVKHDTSFGYVGELPRRREQPYDLGQALGKVSMAMLNDAGDPVQALKFFDALTQGGMSAAVRDS